MNAGKPLRLGLIGGSITSAVGYTHYVATRMDGHYSIEAGCFSRSADVNAASAVAYGVDASRTYVGWREMLEKERGRLDAVLVLTPIPTHRDIVIPVLEAGYPVICEKALASSSAECAQIRQAVESTRGFLAVTFNYSGYPIVRELRNMIAQGELGCIQQIHIEMPQEGFLRVSADGKPATPQSWRLTDGEIPTVSLDLGAHIHHLVHFLRPQASPVEVVAEEATYGHFKQIVDNVYCCVRYTEDLRVQAWYGKTALGRRNGLRVRIFGDRGAAEWFQLEPEELRLWGADGSSRVVDRSSTGVKVASQKRYNRFKIGHPDGFLEAFANVYADIAALLRSHLVPGEAPGEYVFGAAHAESGLLFLEAISRAARTRQWQAVAGDPGGRAR